MYLLLLVGLVTAAAAVDYTKLPGLNYDTWWGPDGEQKDDTRILRTQIKWPKEVIEDLVYRLRNRRPYTPPLYNTNYNYGLNTDTLDYWVDYWANGYNFTQREAYMNQYPHFKTQIQGLWMHFIHIKPKVPKGKNSVPLLLLHGWPGSVREFYGAIKYLTRVDTGRDFVLELVIPSLPGFGYSDATNRPGLGAAEMVFIFSKLMRRLGLKKYFVQGGDWGATIGSNMATLLPDEILGYHSNMPVAFTNSAYSSITKAASNPASIMPTSLISRLYPLSSTFQYIAQESGYLHMQSAKPDVLGVCVGESPTSLVAWFMQFFALSCGADKRDDPMGGVDMFSRDEYIDNLMNYWVPGKITTSFMIYAETFNKRNFHIGYINITTPVPTIAVQTAREILYMPESALRTKFTNLVRAEVYDDYGHFFALEAPEVFSKSVFNGIQSMIEFREKHNMPIYKSRSC